MADITHHQFITLLKKSNVIAEKKLQPWLERTAKIESARKLAKSLVEADLLTTWQAKFLLSGRYRLRIGNYFLLSRLHRDELGARYLAINASLNRKVELQIFSRDLTSDAKRWKEMIQKATLVAKLDHSALVHVYDIDHDDERYFLVVEYVQGRLLDVQKEIFTTPQIGKLILECAEGIEFAHQNQVVHGMIDQADVLLTDKGTVKLRNLAVSPMRKLQNDSPEAEPIADHIALAVLGEKLLAANPGTSSGPGVGLAAIFALMKTEGASAIDQLRQWVEAMPISEVIKSEATKSGAKPIFSSTHESTSSFDLTKQDDVSYRPDVPDANESAVSSASIIRAAKASPTFLVACALGLVMFGGIVAFGISRAYSKMTFESAAEVVEVKAKKLAEKKKAAKYTQKEQEAFVAWETKQAKQTKQAKANSSNESTKVITPKKKRRRKKKKPPKNNRQENPDDVQGGKVTQEEPKQDAERNAAVADQTSSEESKSSLVEKSKKPSNKFLDIFNKKDKAKESAAPAGALVPAPADVEPDSLKKINGIGPVIEKVLYKAGVKTYSQISKMSPTVLDEILEEGGTSKIGEGKWAAIIVAAGPLAEKVAEKAANHFRKVPRVLALPEIESTESVVLTELTIPSNYLLDVELISPNGISPRRIYFELNQVASNDQAWVVSSKKEKTSSNANEIATLKMADSALSFAWLPAADKDKLAVYLQNCLVRLSTPDGRSCVVSLRKPKSVRSLRINSDRLIDTLNVPIEGMPDFDRVRIELARIRGSESLIHLVDASITVDSPGVVALRHGDRNSQSLVLQVAGKRSGKSIKLSAGLTINGRQIKSVSQLKAIQNQLDSAFANAQRQLINNPTDKNLLKLNNLASKNVLRMKEYTKTITWLFEGDDGIGEAIDFQISADFDDGKIELVKSKKNLVGKGKKK